MRNILRLIGKNKRIVFFMVWALTFASIILFKDSLPISLDQKPSQESGGFASLHQDDVYKNLIIETLSIYSEPEDNVYSAIDFSEYHEFLSTPKSNPDWIINAELRAKRKVLDFDKNKDNISIVSVNETQDGDGIILNYLWNDENGIMYFRKGDSEDESKTSSWMNVPYGITKVTPISKTMVFGGYLPAKVTGNVADTMDGGKRVFLMLGQMKTKFLKMLEGYPIYVNAILADGSTKEIAIEEKDFLKHPERSFISGKPLYMNLNFPDVDSEIVGLEFRNLSFEHGVKEFESPPNLKKISIKFYYSSSDQLDVQLAETPRLMAGNTKSLVR